MGHRGGAVGGIGGITARAQNEMHFVGGLLPLPPVTLIASCRNLTSELTQQSQTGIIQTNRIWVELNSADASFYVLCGKWMGNMKRTIVFGFLLVLLAAACTAAETNGSDKDRQATPTVTVYRLPT